MNCHASWLTKLSKSAQWSVSFRPMIEGGIIRDHCAVEYLCDPRRLLHRESCYLEVRRIEGRLPGESEIGALPRVAAGHPLESEWAVRRVSANRLLRHLQRKALPLRILDVGCGNGWLSARMAGVNHSNVRALDINRQELEQGSRVFRECRGLRFCYGDFEQSPFTPGSFDVIVFAASIQYFADVSKIMTISSRLLAEDGELHILDTPVYPDRHAVAAARSRTARYYERLGVPGAAKYYFHHGMDQLQPYRPDYGYRPGISARIGSWLGRQPYVPFPWLIVKRRATGPGYPG